MIEAFVNDTLRNATPIVLAACGGLVTRLSGWLNIGLEGMILLSAFSGVVVSSATSSVVVGTLAAIATSIAVSLLIFVMVRYMRANLYITGIATNLLSGGLTVMLADLWFRSKGTVVFPEAPRPAVSSLDFLGFLNNLNFFDYLAIASPLLLLFVLRGTSFGLKLIACGIDEESAYYSGVNVNRVRLVSFIIAGVFSGLAGASLSLPLGLFVANMSGGRGWIALVAVIMGRDRPFLIGFSALMLGFVTELSIFLQVSTQISPKLLLTIPYFVSFLIVAIFPDRRAMLEGKKHE